MVATEGTKYLGTPIGREAFVNNFIEKKVAEWVSEIEQLSSIAKREPQPVYAAFTHSIVVEWLLILPEQCQLLMTNWPH